MDPFSFAVMAVAQIGIGFLFPAEGPRLKDLKISASTYGAAIPNAYGIVRVAGNMIWTDKIKEIKKKKTVALKRYKYYLYTGTFAMAICRGPITNVRKIWANHKLIYDATGTGKLAIKKTFKFKVYDGGENQMPDPTIEKIVGEGNTPAYRGLAYILFQDMPLEDFGNSIPQISVEVFAQGDGEGEIIGRASPIAFSRITSYQTSEVAYNGEMDMLAVGLTNGGIATLRPSSQSEEGRGATPGLAALLGVSPSTGALVTQGDGGFSNSEPFILYDPVTYEVIGRFGQSSNSTTEFPSGNRVGAFSVDREGREWCMYASVLGYQRALCTSSFGLGGLADLGSQSRGVYGSSYYVGVSGEPSATFYIFEGGDSSGGMVTHLRLYRVSQAGGWAKTEVVAIENEGAISNFQVLGCHYDPADKGVLLVWRNAQRHFIGKYLPEQNRWAWRKNALNAGVAGVQSSVLTTGEFWWVSGSRLYKMNAASGDYIVEIHDPYAAIDPDWMSQAAVETTQSNLLYRGQPIYGPTGNTVNFLTVVSQYADPANGQIVTYGGTQGVQVIRKGLTVKAESTTLAGLVALLLNRAGLTPAQYDLTALQTQPVRGYGWASLSDLRSVLAQLRMLYMFDLVERNGVMVGVMRGAGSNETRVGQPVRRITSRLLGTSGDGQGVDYWKESRIQDADMPRRVHLSYMNWDQDFETSTAQTRRISNPIPAMFSYQQVSMEIGVVMTAKEAKDQVNRMLWAQWAERTQHTTSLPWAYIDLDPADIVDVRFTDGRRYRERLHQTEFGANWAYALETFSQDSMAYESDAVADGGSGVIDPLPFIPPRAAKAIVLNTPLMRDADDTGGAYSLHYLGVAHGGQTPFDGAGMWRSVDGASYELVYLTDQDTEWAQVSGIVPPPRHGAHGLDWETRITLWPTIDWFELESITDDELWDGANLCALGAELIQFRDCVENADGSWTIWNLLRGRRGTEYACASHGLGEMFVVLSPNTIEPGAELLDQRAKTRWHRAVGDGIKPELSPATITRYEPRDLMPYAPKDIRRSVSGSSVTLTWKRRTRMGGNMQDLTGSVPLNEGRERYEVFILKAPFSGDLSRSDEVPAESQVLYRAETDSAMLTFDVSGFLEPFDVNLDSIHVLIYQLSTAVGRGFPGVRSIEPWQDF
ncbi:putative tail protein [Brevundimonas phage vB_BpoS-Marchewka]|uniref:Tail protein n=1 Tax=Brevundimonas phage vB_BpoS-Marchewka TaxID=2948604 RepID=A0A9E7N385_9CAUD|nr:putative tail protein [Brevundimonas phage vB_BpoS-Marchewka]